MKQYRSISQYIILAATLLLTACNDWLDVQPRSQVEDTELFSTESGYKEALSGIYSSMASSKTYTKEMTFGFIGVLGQEWDYYYAAQYDDAAAYDYDAALTTGYIRNIWSTSYNSIANANNLLAHIDDDASLFAADNYQVIKGETVRQAAEAVLADLQQAEALLQGADPIVTGREITESTDNGYLLNRQLHLNYYAVKALKARVYLWMGKYAEAQQEAESVIRSGQFTWASVANLQSGSDRCLADEHLFALNNLTLEADVANAFFSDDSQYAFAVTRDRLLDYYDNATQDYRYTFLFKAGTATHSNNRYLTKYDTPSGSSTHYRFKMPLMRLSEMYLIKSETEYRSGNAEAARLTLNTLRTARNLPTLAELPADYYQELAREYRREFMGEGQLFFLYKRLNSPVISYANIDAVAEKVYTFPLPITETEATERNENK